MAVVIGLEPRLVGMYCREPLRGKLCMRACACVLSQALQRNGGGAVNACFVRACACFVRACARVSV